MQAHPQRIAPADLRGVGDRGAAGAGDHRVPAGQDVERRTGADGVGGQQQAVAALQQPRLHGARGRRHRVIEPLRGRRQRQAEAPLQPGRLKALQDEARPFAPPVQTGEHRRGGGAQAAQQVVAFAGDQLGGGRRGRGAHVGGQIGQRRVGLVADRAHHRQLGPHDRLYHRFVGERQQVLQRAAAAGQDDHVAHAVAAGGPQPGGDEAARSGALYLRRQDHQIDAGMPPPQHVEDVAQRRSGRRGDHHHAPRHAGDRPLALQVEAAARGQPALALL